MNINKFINDHLLLTVCTLGLVVVGYLGYHTVKCLFNQCRKAKKIDSVSRENLGWWSAINASNDLQNFKRNWKKLTLDNQTRKNVTKEIREIFEKTDYQNNNPLDLPNQPLYGAPLGKVFGLADNFGMWMPGVAIAATYLSEKKHAKDLFVCASLEALGTRIKEIALNDADQRCAFVVPSFGSGYYREPSYFEPNFPQHKTTVCVEKIDGHLTIALLDAQPAGTNNTIRPTHVMGNLWDGYNKRSSFNCQELVYRAILTACQSANCNTRLLHSQVKREIAYGCGVYALQDGMAFLRNKNFFEQVHCSDKTVKIDPKYQIEVIDLLPPEFMVGTQSLGLLNEYKENVGQSVYDQVLPGKRKSLQDYLNKYLLRVKFKGSEKTQNHYVTNKTFKYLKFVAEALQTLGLDEIKQIVNRTLITKVDDSLFPLPSQSRSKGLQLKYLDFETELESYIPKKHAIVEEEKKEEKEFSTQYYVGWKE